jgi:leucyl aminopeptidase
MRLQIVPRAALPKTLEADVLVLGVFEHREGGRASSPTTRARSKAKSGNFGVDFEHLDKASSGALSLHARREEFTGKKEQVISLSGVAGLTATRIMVVGLGDEGRLTAGDLRTFAAKAIRAANGFRASSVGMVIPKSLRAHLRPIGEGLELGAYRFTKYLTGERHPKTAVSKVILAIDGKLSTVERASLEFGQAVGDAINLTRDLGNEPSNVMTPAALADAASAMAKRAGVKVRVFDFKEIVRQGMKLIQAVGQGSANEPRFVHMSYVPKSKAKRRLVFVGKGITFDSGGLSIKPAAGMGEMKADMSGAGNMVGLMAAVARLKPSVEVHAIMACAENMPDGKSYRPGDVWGSLDGKTVEIVNTDAEGRLLLADALAYARKLNPDLLVDNATLTGACVVALGNTCSGYYASNDESAEAFAAALKISNESMWRLPLLDDLREQIKSDIADVKQTGDRYGGSITAALFLREFVGTVKNWVHVDIAGPALADRATGWSPKGATGHGVLTLLAMVENASK